MKKGIRNTLVLSLSLFLFLGMSQAVMALDIQPYNVDTESEEISDWLSGRSGVGLIEDFEDDTIETGWYQYLETSIGTFRINEDTVAGTGSSSFAQKNNNNNSNNDNVVTFDDTDYDPTYNYDEDAYFEIRAYNADGRFNTTPGDGTKYLDSADISSFTLDVDGDYNHLFFYMTDPSDVEAITSTGASTGRDYTWGDGIDFDTDNDGSLWFVGIDAGDDFINSIKWTAFLDDDESVASDNDGFGIDGLAQVPEPATLLLLGTGLVGVAGFARRRRLNRS